MSLLTHGFFINFHFVFSISILLSVFASLFLAFPPRIPAFLPPFPTFPHRFFTLPPLFPAFPPPFSAFSSFRSPISHSGFYR